MGTSTPTPVSTSKPEEKKIKPDFYIHAVVPNQRGRGNRIGASIGVVFNHKKGEGFTLYLDAVPIAVDGQIELVGYKPKQP